MALKLKKQGGFTLIELLIVITIIGILAVTLVPRLTGGQERARDASRKADLQQFATALEFYADDNSGDYPAATACLSSLSGATELGSYLTTLPTDPRGDSVDAGSCADGYIYFPIDEDSDGDADGYLLIASVEGESDGDGLYEAGDFTSLDGGDDASTNLNTNISTCTTGDCMYIVGR